MVPTKQGMPPSGAKELDCFAPPEHDTVVKVVVGFVVLSVLFAARAVRTYPEQRPTLGPSGPGDNEVRERNDITIRLWEFYVAEVLERCREGTQILFAQNFGHYFRSTCIRNSRFQRAHRNL